MGYEEGGQLTEAVHRRPYSVVLLDEIEKAHQDVFNVLLQVMDDGRLTDAKGRTVDFSQAILVMTSNIGSRWIQELSLSDPETMRERVLDELRSTFRPEFLNRLDEVVMFRSLSREDLMGIVDIQLAALKRRLGERGLSLELGDEAKRFLGEAGYDPVYGARPLKRAIQRYLENPLSRDILAGKFPAGTAIKASIGADGLAFEPVPEVVN